MWTVVIPRWLYGITLPLQQTDLIFFLFNLLCLQARRSGSLFLYLVIVSLLMYFLYHYFTFRFLCLFYFFIFPFVFHPLHIEILFLSGDNFSSSFIHAPPTYHCWLLIFFLFILWFGNIVFVNIHIFFSVMASSRTYVTASLQITMSASVNLC